MCGSELTATRQLPACFVLLRILRPDFGLVGMSQSPAASFARLPSFTRKAMNRIASFLFLLCWAIEKVCGFAA
jgi:hypothetical protein